MGEDWLTGHLRECAAVDHLPCAEGHIGRLVTAIMSLRSKVDDFKQAVERMDTKMTPLSVEGSEFVEMYQVMAGPWHRLLGLARSPECRRQPPV